MIRILFSFFILISVFVSHAQGSLHSMAVTVSNNGHLSSVSDEFYFTYENMKAFFQPGRTLAEDHTAFKSTLEYSYLAAQNLELGAACGFGLRKNSYLTDVSKIKASQHYLSLLPFVLKTWEVRGLQLAVGGGIPIHVAGKFKASSTEHADWIPQDIIAHNNLAGGGAFGISAIGRIRWFFTPRLSVMTMVNFGMLYSDFGGDFEVVPDANSYPFYFDTRTRRQRGISLPAPELSFGLGFRI